MVCQWGAIDFVSETCGFDYTDYYEKELGSSLWRKIISFEALISPELLSSIKHLTNEIEASLSSEDKRRMVNIDPGYINAYHLILGTTKPAPHRPYLQSGIYSDLTLLYQEKSFGPLAWTYPDYRSEKIIDIIGFLRKKYLFQLKLQVKKR